MNNNMYVISSEKILEIKRNIKKEVFVVEIYSKKIENEKELYYEMMYKFDLTDDFIYKKRIIYDAYIDWMTDLTWIEESKDVCLIIYDFFKLIKIGVDEVNLFIDMFVTNILPFWEEEVIHTVVEGKRRRFNVYLVVNDDE
ncbi:hypothetical protein OKW23_000493 [Bacilli bacterium PM5-9]|nr:hypothetical protein [Bacilli bacterium PM5-9]